tara:strand:- start:439 stop:681 length:243 start_codon:yes stop_codon:yes gene_type:complete
VAYILTKVNDNITFRVAHVSVFTPSPEMVLKDLSDSFVGEDCTFFGVGKPVLWNKINRARFERDLISFRIREFDNALDVG